jgi:pyrroloquinoline quinone (PQQ) biosynthesis protein C
VEHFKSPYGPGDFVSSRIVENQKFFDEMLQRSKGHRYYSHPFMSALEDMTPSRDAVTFVLTSIYKIVVPFTGLLCSLGGRAPDLRSRFALMDNIYEEMGCGDLNAAHPNLYLKMLTSIGISPNDADGERTLPTVRRMNEHLREVVDRRNFAVACAVLASAEAVIPPLFPVLSKIATRAFPDIDRTFFDRHGPRDEGHSDDAAMLFAVTADSSDFATVLAEVDVDLDFRAELLDEWLLAVRRGGYVGSAISERPPRMASDRPMRRGSIRPPRVPSVRPPAHRPSVPPPG